MSDWRSVAAAARRAGALFSRDRQAGEAEFRRLLEQHPRDGMLLYERGRALAAAGEIDAARADLEDAVRQFPMVAFKERARAALEALPSSMSTVTPPNAPRRTLPVPTPEELLTAHHIFVANEPRASDFRGRQPAAGPGARATRPAQFDSSDGDAPAILELRVLPGRPRLRREPFHRTGHRPGRSSHQIAAIQGARTH